jgi:murein DD-endopeptidase MepM/ murein hydrolase activator NlpD
VYYETTKKEVIPYNKVTQKSDTLYVGKSKVHQKGEDGSQEVTYKTKTVNGKEEYTQPVYYVILEQPKDQITYKGTKEKPKEETSSSTSSSSSGSSSSNDESDSDEEQESDSAAESPTGGFIWPVSSHEIMCGWYCYPGHDGLDFTAWYGAPIYAADGGTVTRAGYSGDMGNYVVIDHGNGYHTRYMHMSSTPPVSAGDTVSQGEVIGYVGQTGYTTAPHLHFEVIYNGSAINPFEVLP